MPQKPHHIIAIGGSAGGLEEIKTFFDYPPIEGVSYVVIQPLSIGFKSRMVELLSRHSQLAVKEAKNAMEVIRNEVYLIPNDMFMTIQDGFLYLTEKSKFRSPHLTITTFFTSFAADMGRKAIGIIFSGLGSDGADGVIAINRSGGIVLARNPETTEFGSMPSNAIATGCVDFILEPKMMPSAIEEYIKKEIDSLSTNLTDEQNVASIVALIKGQLPLDFSDYKRATILRRIKRRAASHNLSKLEDYVEILKNSPEELSALAKDFLISVTSFFRDNDAFQFLDDQIIPDLIKGLSNNEELRLWIPGCATGEEAYSFAMIINDHLAELHVDHPVKIFATDMDTAAIQHANKGVYSSSAVADIPDERLAKYFFKQIDGYKINSVIRKMVIFAQHDMVKNPPYCNMHLISCRNLLIYMTPALQRKIYLMLLFGLKQDGILFLGPSENPLPILQSLEVVNKTWKVYKNLNLKKVVRFDAFSLPEIYTNRTNVNLLSEEKPIPADVDLAEALNETIVKKLSSVAVCINADSQIIKSYGNINKFFLPKILTTNLSELLPQELAIALTTVRRRVAVENEAITVKKVQVLTNQSARQIDLSVEPVIYRGKVTGLLLVTFEEESVVALPNANVIAFNESEFFNQYTIGLEQEVLNLKENLAICDEKLHSYNQNMQSFNEELLSVNEELQSTNEELQSVNEKLITINTDYQLANKELLKLNDELNNYFRSNINGQLFIDDQLRLMKFSPVTDKLINLLESDIGRPISNITNNFKSQTIISDIKQVIADGSVITKEVESNDNKWFKITTMPYLNFASGKISGAIVTFTDITELKTIQNILQSRMY